jgi:hypothetical protein
VIPAEKNGYPTLKVRLTVKRRISWNARAIIIHGKLVDDMMHIPTCDAIKQEFIEKYTKDFDITGGGLMETYLGIQVEQSPGKIRLHLNNYIRETLDEFKAFQTKFLRPKLVQIQPGIVLDKGDSIDRSSLDFNLQQHGFVWYLICWGSVG